MVGIGTKRRRGAADTIIETVEAYAPGFEASILGRQVLSPKGLERKFGLAGGDIMHGSMTLDQLWCARPIMGTAAIAGRRKAATCAEPERIRAAV